MQSTIGFEIAERLRIRDVDWAVIKCDVHSGRSHEETQWTLACSGKGLVYLIRTDSLFAGDAGTSWVLTERIPLNHVQYLKTDGVWADFTSKGRYETPFLKLRCKEKIFDFTNENRVLAKDDEGRSVSKVTWDYYDSSGVSNVAIELWKEKDGDYPEAFSGVKIDRFSIRRLPGKAVEVIYRRPTKMGRSFFGFLALLMLFSLAFVPADRLMVVFVPVLACAWALITPSGTIFMMMLIVSILLMGLTLAWGLAGGFGIIFGLVSGCGLILPWIMHWGGVDISELYLPERYIVMLLPGAWLASFTMYFLYAPGPRNLMQLFITCLWPVAMVALVYAIFVGLRKLCVRKT